MAIVEPPSQRATTRVRGLASWQPRDATLALLDTVQGVLAEYADYLPLTLRQVFYRLVGAHGYDKTERAYSRLGECLNRARRAGLIAFQVIRDDDAETETTTGWESAGELIETWLDQARYFRLDRQQGQPHRLLMMVEARGMKPQIEAVASDYGVPVIASGGFDSLTAKYQLASSLGRCSALTEVLHIGDHDPSGVHLFLSMADDIGALIRDRDLPGQVRFTRLAVTPAQIAELGLPTAPPKETDRRSFEGDTVQAEAIPPDALAQIVAGAIHERLDEATYQSVLDRELRIRRDLSDRLRSLLNRGSL